MRKSPEKIFNEYSSKNKSQYFYFKTKTKSTASITTNQSNYSRKNKKKNTKKISFIHNTISKSPIRVVNNYSATFNIKKNINDNNNKNENENDISSPIISDRSFTSYNFENEKYKIKPNEVENKNLNKIKNEKNEINYNELENTSLNNLILPSNNDKKDYSINPIEMAEQIKNREDKINQLIAILQKREDLREMLSEYYETDIIDLLNSPELDTDIIESMFSTIEEIEKLKLRDEINEEDDEDSHSV